MRQTVGSGPGHLIALRQGRAAGGTSKGASDVTEHDDHLGDQTSNLVAVARQLSGAGWSVILFLPARSIETI